MQHCRQYNVDTNALVRHYGNRAGVTIPNPNTLVKNVSVHIAGRLIYHFCCTTYFCRQYTFKYLQTCTVSYACYIHTHTHAVFIITVHYVIQ